MRKVPDSDLLEIVGCNIESRPQAPGISELAPTVLSNGRSGEALRIEFSADVAKDVLNFATAERVCCSGVNWDVVVGEEVVLTIRASEEALDILEGAFKSQLYIEKHQ
jgi:hypothetical protein